MRSVNFDNPWLLLLAIPLILSVIIPFVIAIRKENRQKSAIISLAIHISIVVLVSLAAAGAMITTVLTETTVYVVADVSYSSQNELDEIDSYIEEIEDNLPRNTKLGVVCFGLDSVVLYEPGEKRKSVKEAQIDSSATDIAAALNYTAALYKEDVIKKMVLITDASSTDTKSRGKLISTMESLEQKKIALDAIFVNSTILDGEKEIQVSDVQFVGATYLDSGAVANVLIQSNYEGNAIVTLYAKAPNTSDYVAQPYTVEEITYGYNTIKVPLLTSESGEYDYYIEVEGESDTCLDNNKIYFAQKVSEELSVLLVTGEKLDVTVIEEMLDGKAVVESVYVKDGKPQSHLPYTVEELSSYDEIIISNLDIRELPNVTSFISSVEIAVSQLGKSLTTMGDLHIQNKTDATLGALGDMLPLNYGNSSADPKIYTLVLDTSHSMNQASKFIATKEAAKSLLSLLSDEDMVCVVGFSQDSRVIQPVVRVGDKRNAINEMIDGLEPSQGTFLGTALDLAYRTIKDYTASEKQVMLISDGKTSAYDLDAKELTKSMARNDIVVSTINVACQEATPKQLLQKIAEIGQGKSYFLEDPEDASTFVFAEVADDVTETIIEADTPVHIEEIDDAILRGKEGSEDDIVLVPNIQGYVQTKAKVDATVVLSVDYVKESEIMRVPLYSYREYGNGKVATFTTSISSDWTSSWDDSFKSLFLGNMLNSNTPSEKKSQPFDIMTSFDGAYIRVDLIPADLRADGVATLTITLPNGEKIEGINFIFDTQKYFYEQEIDLSSDHAYGKYMLEINYSYDENPDGINCVAYQSASYPKEYDRFVSYSPSALHSFVTGEVVKESAIKVENDKNDLATYEYRFAIPFLIISAVLFIADVAIRVIKIRKKSKVTKGAQK